LKKCQDLEIWNTDLEDLRVRLEAMGSNISENQFMIYILNNVTLYYELQLVMMESRVGDAEKPLTIEDIRGELSLRYERLNKKSKRSREVKVLKETAFLSAQLKGKSHNCGQVGHISS
jgi:hypothetical protein